MISEEVRRGEMFYIYSTEITGSEQAGGRPGIIVSNDIGNQHSSIVEVVYLTTKEKKPLPTHVSISSAAKPSVALCEQIESISKGRLGNYICQISEAEQKNIDTALAISLGINLNVRTNKLLEKWINAYSEIEGNCIQVPPDIVSTPESADESKRNNASCKSCNFTEAEILLIEYKAGLEIYKGLYRSLVEKLIQHETK